MTFLPNVPIVDPLKDEGIWITVDSACNTSCHARAWRENADQKLAIIGKALGYHESEWKTWWHKKVPHSISGVGNYRAQVNGSHLIPIATTTLKK